ncbi:class I SAM-dependent methyltransferase [Ferdinandcohnia quinoae]|uniref:Class I SAM-dependent methyltransferase n=1 Tax=Fredinandcohnia quinoae TaxID=2918902 RepID=A0AAW5E8Y9_9BACI|nr:class I SAM-dependent methyltransferase [Fredinandcohnia sp. SECRCQ15]MCH1627710.1 class I SAM-dependent methyltransferase [Fredinandcohnia sp. SECRCQ15]
MALLDPTTFPDWLPPHSLEWYKQLSNLQDKYIYSWNSTLTEPNGESIFDEEVAKMIPNKKVLDIGCGHGEFTLKCGGDAKEIVGFDVTDHFVRVGLENKKPNVSFVIGNTKDGLPFEKDEFDCAYIRKGPTSAYPFLKQVIKKGGKVIGLHPGDELGRELPLLFPKLFEITKGTQILHTIKRRLESSNCSYTRIETINSIEYINSPLDVLKLRCFGQHPTIYEKLKNENLSEISRIFKQNATEYGLPITFSRYIVRVIV